MYYTGSSFSRADQALAKFTQPTVDYVRQQAKPALESAQPAIKYGQYFGAGFLTQAGLNQGLGIAKTSLDLPNLTQQQIGLLTATGSAFAVLPLMMTLSSAAGLGLASVLDTMKGATESQIKDTVARDIDTQYAYSISDHAKKIDFETKSFYDRLKAEISAKKVAEAVAKSSLLTRGLVLASTLAAILGPKAVEYFSLEEESAAVAPLIPLTPAEEDRERLKRMEAKLNASPMESIMKIRPEQLSFFAGQLAASTVPNTFGLKYWNQFKAWRQALSPIK